MGSHPHISRRGQFIARLATDEGFVYFDFATTATKFASVEFIPQSKTQPLHHEPCRLLGDSESPRDFATAHAVLAIDQHPKSSHPLVEAKGRVFKDRSQFERELFLAGLASDASQAAPGDS